MHGLYLLAIHQQLFAETGLPFIEKPLYDRLPTRRWAAFYLKKAEKRTIKLAFYCFITGVNDPSFSNVS